MKKHAEQESQKEATDAQKENEANKGTGAEGSGAAETAASAETKAKTGETAPAEETAAAAGTEKADFQSRIAELEKLNADLQDQYLRKAADFDNYRKRMIREKQDAIDFANTNLLVDLVQVLDDFDRAMGHADQFEAGSPAAALAEGVTMIRTQLGTMLDSKYGLTYYPSKDTTFDPNIHEAIGTLPSPDVKEPTVAEEFMKGYKLKERIIRPAKVMVKMPVEQEK